MVFIAYIETTKADLYCGIFMSPITDSIIVILLHWNHKQNKGITRKKCVAKFNGFFKRQVIANRKNYGCYNCYMPVKWSFLVFVGQLKSNWRLPQYYMIRMHAKCSRLIILHDEYSTLEADDSHCHIWLSHWQIENILNAAGDDLFFFFLFIFPSFLLWSRRLSHYLISMDIFHFFFLLPFLIPFLIFFSTFDFTISIYPLFHLSQSYCTQHWLLYSQLYHKCSDNNIKLHSLN